MVTGNGQSGEWKSPHDITCGPFPNDGHDRKLLCTFLPRVDARNCYLRFCRDLEFDFLPSSKQQRRVEYLSRHGWVVDKHIENSPQVVMKRISGYVAEIFIQSSHCPMS